MVTWDDVVLLCVVVVALWDLCVAAVVLLAGLGRDWVTPGPAVVVSWDAGDAGVWSEVELVSLLVELVSVVTLGLGAAVWLLVSLVEVTLGRLVEDPSVVVNPLVGLVSLSVADLVWSVVMDTGCVKTFRLLLSNGEVVVMAT